MQTPEKKTRSEKRQRTVTISVRLNAAELESIEAAAKWWKVSTSKFVRDSALQNAARPFIRTTIKA